jgi:hypothetical protein
MDKTIFTTKTINASFEGITFEGGIFATDNPDKIARLRKSYFYGRDFYEVDPNQHDGQAPLANRTNAQLAELIKDKEWLNEKKRVKAELLEKIASESIDTDAGNE